MQRTLGGDRLGSGKKQKVNLHGYERSTHDMGYVWRSTMSAGTLVPFMKLLALPGDTFDINLGMDGKTHPTVGPLFGSYKAQLDVFQCPIRLYNALLHNNSLGIGLDMTKVKFPTITMTPLETPAPESAPENFDLDNSQINPSCLLSYLGIRGIGRQATGETNTRTFNAIPILAYWDIYKQYYANKQEEVGAVIHTPAVAIITTVTSIKIFTAGTETTIPTGSSSSVPMILGSQIRIYFTGTVPIPAQEIITTQEQGDQSAEALSTGTGWTNATTYIWAPFRQTYWGNLTATSWRYIDDTDINTGNPAVETFTLTNIDDMRKAILANWDETAPFDIDADSGGGSGLEPYKWLAENANDIPNTLSSQEGLGIKTYQSDLFNNWLKTENIDAITTTTAIDVSGGTLEINALLLARKVYDYLNRIAVSGGTYDDWLDVTYDNERYRKCESPIYEGGLIKELVFQEVVSNSQSEEQPLGTLAGKGTMASKHKGGNLTIKVDEPSYIIGIVSLTPRLDYSQGNDWDIHLETMNDLHKPQLDELGFQELLTEQMAWWDTYYDTGTNAWITPSAGKQPAWINYMTDINKTRGNFAINTNEMFMTLNRRYEPDTDYSIKDLTTYIDPSKFNFIFAETALDAQNFWVQIACDITARRKMSAKVMPNL